MPSFHGFADVDDKTLLRGMKVAALVGLLVGSSGMLYANRAQEQIWEQEPRLEAMWDLERKLYGTKSELEEAILHCSWLEETLPTLPQEPCEQLLMALSQQYHDLQEEYKAVSLPEINRAELKHGLYTVLGVFSLLGTFVGVYLSTGLLLFHYVPKGVLHLRKWYRGRDNG